MNMFKVIFSSLIRCFHYNQIRSLNHQLVELISYYKRQKLELRDDGTRLIRPIARPEYMINNDEVHTSGVLGKVSLVNTSRRCLSIFFERPSVNLPLYFLRVISVKYLVVNIVVNL